MQFGRESEKSDRQIEQLELRLEGLTDWVYRRQGIDQRTRDLRLKTNPT